VTSLLRKEESDTNARLSCLAFSRRVISSESRSFTCARTRLSRWDAWPSLAVGAATTFVEDETKRGSLGVLALNRMLVVNNPRH